MKNKDFSPKPPRRPPPGPEFPHKPKLPKWSERLPQQPTLYEKAEERTTEPAAKPPTSPVLIVIVSVAILAMAVFIILFVCTLFNLNLFGLGTSTPPSEGGVPQTGAGLHQEYPQGLSGEWVSRVPGTGFVNTMIPGPFTFYCDVVLNLDRSGNTVTGSSQTTLRDVVINPGWADSSIVESDYPYWKGRVGTTQTDSVSGTVSGNSISITGTMSDITYTLTYTGDRLYGDTQFEAAGIKYKSTFDLKRK